MAAPASAGVLAYRGSDGSADPAFVKLAPSTSVERVVPDGAHGDDLIGSIAVAGSQRKMVHLLADGGVDPVPPPLANGPTDPIAHAVALVGSHVLVFTQRLG